jgi:peptidoglycan lytic transglycosylase
VIRLPGVLLALAALPAAALLAGCAPYRSAARPDSGPVATAGAQEPPGERGNPPFYDVLGRRYFVLKTSDGYRARGIASWYGREFNGLKTSSGEPYDMHAMTAAHTTLPIPTWVEVTNLDNRKRVIVKVNDRGPFVDNRLIDLSYAAAQALDMVRSGTARVEVRALGAPAAPEQRDTVAAAPVAPVSAGALIAAAPVAPGSGLPALGAAARSAPPAFETRAPEPPPERLFVQVGAFAERGNAMRLVDRLRASGFPNTFVVSERDGSRLLHRVRVGPLDDAAEFDRLDGRLRRLGVDGSRLIVDP